MSNEVFEICKEKVDLSKLKANNQCLCIDGTATCFKTTITDVLRKKHNRIIYKVQTKSKFASKNINTHALAMMGYMDKGTLDIYNCNVPHYGDRSPLNPFDWNFIWRYMDKMKSRFGLNFDIDKDMGNAKDILDELNVEIEEAKNHDLYLYYRKRFNILVLIDSNCKEVDERRRLRDEGSDTERSNWGFYTFIQNIVYSKLYEGLFIDLSWFKCCKSDIIDGLVRFFEYSLNSIVGKADYAFIEKCNRIELEKSRINIDYATENMKSYVSKISLKEESCKITKADFDKNLIPKDILYEEVL